MTEQVTTPERSYGCSMGCGNPYDFIRISVQDATTLFLCFPCDVQMMVQSLQALQDADDPEIAAMLADAGTVEQTPMNSGVGRRRGHHAPAEENDPDALEAFDGVVTVDELPDAFR